MEKVNIMVEYIWLDGSTPQKLRSKTKIIRHKNLDNSTLIDSIKLPDWNYDGSSTNQADANNSELILKPHSKYLDPFNENGIIVMCGVFNVDGTPHDTNNRSKLKEILHQKKPNKPYFGVEQEYVMFDREHDQPIGWPKQGFPKPQGDYYCGVGANYVSGRDISLEHANLCMISGINITGINAEVLLGQWEYQIFSQETLRGMDDIWISRYILYRLGEKNNVYINIHPKPYEGNSWNGSGMHFNFSTEEIRENKNRQELIEEACEKLKKTHKDHILVYGSENNKRLTGDNETGNINKFTWGYGDRTASVRIPISVREGGVGYLEDRRPASNADPYEVAYMLLKTIC